MVFLPTLTSDILNQGNLSNRVCPVRDFLRKENSLFLKFAHAQKNNFVCSINNSSSTHINILNPNVDRNHTLKMKF